MQGAFNQYFSIFPFDRLTPNAVGFDMGCGSGRWARLVAPKVGFLNCIDASSQALDVTKRKLKNLPNVAFHCASVDDVRLEPQSQDFGYCLGVLHHIPDTAAGIESCGRLLKPGAPFLLYLYYSFENRGMVFRTVWKASDCLRRGISVLPFSLKKTVTWALAAAVY
ncbi:MAG: class I SAM-dependent methyltransferase, partial [Limnobacter sp.]|nr:class I SAM-dependent methyltransferase [Limnobacter sp.]